MSSKDNLTRCNWSVKTQHEQDYHDKEWGVAVHDDRLLFEMLTLEGAQAGLSWSTVLAKRSGYKAAFDNFEIKKVSNYSKTKETELKLNPAIVRNKLKIAATVTNAKAFIEIQNEFGSFDTYLWQFVAQTPIQNSWQVMGDVPVSTLVSDKLSKDLKKRGFKFVGTTICYAYMQAVGMVNDHLLTCYRHSACS